MRPTTLALTLALLAAAAGPAVAATLGVPTRGAPVISGHGTAFLDPLLGFDLLGDGAASSTDPAAATDLLVTVPFADLAAPRGALFVTSAGGQPFLSGDLARVGIATNPAGADRIELLFGDLDGGAAGAFRPLALLAVTGEFGADPLGGFASFEHPADVEMSVAAAIPLPASLVTLLLGIGALWLPRVTRARGSTQG